jgi:hypothetical protein
MSIMSIHGSDRLGHDATINVGQENSFIITNHDNNTHSFSSSNGLLAKVGNH